MVSDKILCILYAILAYTMINIGLVLEKKGASELPAIENTNIRNNIKNFLKKPEWLVGFILLNLQIIPFLAAVSYGPISLVAPMIGVGMVFLVVFSVFYLRETINRPMYVGIGLTIVGIVVFGAAGGGEEARIGWEETLNMVGRAGSILFLSVLFAGAAIPAIVSASLKYRNADIFFGVGSGFAASLGMIFSKLMMAGFDMGDLGSSFAVNVVRWQFYVFLILLSAGNAGSMVMQQFGFQKGKAIVLAPIFTVCIVLIPSITGIVLFNEWSIYSINVIRIKVAAMAVLMVGVAILSCFNADKG